MGIHDLNNLLFAVSSNLELAILEGSVEGDAENRIERSLFILRSVVDIVNKFQEMLRLGSSEFQLKTVAVDVRKLLGKTLLILEAEMRLKDVAFVFRGPPKCEICGDRDLLERIMINLLENAVKFARAGTDICFHIENSWNEQSITKFFLSNHCRPLPEEFREKIFEMFQQCRNAKKRERGKGIGLSFCKSAIERLGGSIWIESPLKGQNEGFAVHFTLPSYPYS